MADVDVLMSQTAAALPPLAPSIHDIATRRLSPRKQSPHPLAPDPLRRRPETQQHSRSSAPPPSAHVSLVRSEQDECSAVWDEASGAWQITACPALRPTAREQVVHLRACLNRMLQAEQAQRGAGGGSAASLDLLQLLDCAPPAELDRQYSALHAIFTAGLHELARQVAINCVERGELLTSLWASSEAIKARLLQRKARDEAGTRAHLAELEARCASRCGVRCVRLQLGCLGLQHGCMRLQAGRLGLQAARVAGWLPPVAGTRMRRPVSRRWRRWRRGSARGRRSSGA